MSRNPTSYAEHTFGVEPGTLYTITGFTRTSGISKTRQHEARLMGLPLPTVDCGKRKFVRGRDGIEWIERLSELLAERS